MMMFEFYGKKIESCSKEFFGLKVARLLGGSDLTIPVHVIHGHAPGPVLGIFAAIHGTEYYQNRILRRIVSEVEPDTIKGTILAVPVANPPAFSHMTRQTPRPPEETVDFANLNRVFPGKRLTPLFGSMEPSDVSLTMKMAQILTEEVVEKCTHVIDYHGQMPGMALKKILFNLDPESKEMARVFGLGLLHDPPEEDISRGALTTLTSYASGLGIKGIVPEIGGGGHSEQFERECERIGVRGTLNVMIYLGMMEGEILLPEKQFYFRNAPHVRAPAGGYLISNMMPEDVGIGRQPREVRKDEVLGTLYNPYTLKEIEEIKSPAAGLLYACRISGLVEAKSEVLAVADYKDSMWVE
jgi:predicted deacylase